MPLVASNLITDWRRALISELRSAYPQALVESKRRSGVNKDAQARIAIFFDGYDEEAGRVSVARPQMMIRYWPPRSDIETSDDPTELEQAAYDLVRLLEDRMKQVEIAVDDLWYFRVVSAQTDDDPTEWGVELRLVGFARNIAVPA
jgi:hypothetical protein